MAPRVRRSEKVANNGRMTVRQAMQIMHEFSAASLHEIMRGRAGTGTGINPDPRKNIDKECGYKPDPDSKDFKEMYDRFGLAARIVNLLPDECFAVNPEIYENENRRDTAFQKAYNDLIRHPDLNPNYFFRKSDALSGVGEHGGILIGTSDLAPLNTIAAGMREDGTMTPERPRNVRPLYFRAFDETVLKVKETNTDPLSPRFGMPQFYELIQDASLPNGAKQIRPLDIHWSRVVHVAECRYNSNEWKADSRLKKVNEPIWDIRKIMGGSAEMFWKGGFPGLAATVDPRFLEAGGIEVDEETITEDMQRFMEGLQKHILGVGLKYDQLMPAVADPTQHLMMQFSLIAMSIGIPLRVFMGSEEAKLASGQDMKAWGRRIKGRQNDYLTPKLIRPFVYRLIATGVLPPTRKVDTWGWPVFNVFWPDIAVPDENERSTVSDRDAAAMMKFVMGGCHQMMQPSDFMRFILKRDPLEIDEIMKNLKKGPEIQFKDPNASEPEKATKKGRSKPPSSGSKGTPPSDSPVGAIKD